MQVGADPRRRLRRDRSFAEQVDRHAARGARVGVGALRPVGSHFGIERLRQVDAVDLVPAPLVLLVLAVAEARFPVPAVRNLAAQARPAADRLALVFGDLAADLVEAAIPGDADAGGRRFVAAQFGGDEGIAGAITQARDLAIFDLGRDACDRIGQRIGRIPADTDRFARFARGDPRILELREGLDRVGKFKFELGGAEIAFAREDQRATGALVVAVAIGQEIARVAVVGGSHSDRLARLDIGAERRELAVPVKTVAPRTDSRKHAARNETAEIAHHQRRKFGRRTRSAGGRAVFVDIDPLELVDAIIEIIIVGHRPHRPFAVDRADAPVAVIGAAEEEIAASVGEARAIGRAERQLLPVALRGDARTCAQRQAALILLGDDVDHARDRVRTIDRRGAAGDDLDPVDEIAGDRRQADEIADPRVRHGAAAVDEDERAVRAQVTQFDRAEARILRVAGDRRIIVRRRQLRQVGKRLAEFAIARFEQIF